MAKQSKKNNKEIIKRKKYALIIGIIFILIALLINKSTVIRLLLSLLSIGCISTSICYKEKELKHFIPLIVMLLLFSSMILDTIVSYTLKRFPIYSYNIITNKNTKVYNAIGIRVWQCDKNSDKLIVTPFYSKGFTCDPEDMEAIDSNAFLEAIQNDYNEYKNNYIKIRGKISKISGSNIVDMQPYEESDLTIDGHVSFFENITLRIILNEDKGLEKYDIYDDITIVGVVKNLETSNNQTVIYMYEGKVVSNIDLNDYEITVITDKQCQNIPIFLYEDEENRIYTYCVNDVMITYDRDNIYDLQSAFASNKINIDTIVNSMKLDKKEKNQELYTSKNYNIIKCDNNYIIGYNKLSLKNNVCSLIEETN